MAFMSSGHWTPLNFDGKVSGIDVQVPCVIIVMYPATPKPEPEMSV